MKDKFTQNDNQEEVIDQALRSLSEKIDADAVFKSELEQRLVTVHQARSSSSMSFFRQALPMLGWAMGLVVLALFLNWVIRGIVPTPPVPAAEITISPTIETTVTPSSIDEASTPVGKDGYDWRDTKLYLEQPLPQSPVKANIYLKKFAEQATREDVLALAQRFEIDGEIQEVPGDIPGETNYRISDGKERLEVRPDHSFKYHSNFGEQLYLDNLFEGQARIIADNFLKKHGFDFEYKLESSPDMQGTQFFILPLTPDGYEMRFDYMQPVRYQIFMDNTGENIIFTGDPIEYESVGTFGIITVEDALQKILDPNPQTGLMEMIRGQGGGGGGGVGFYKLNLSGTPVPFPTPTPQPEVNQGSSSYIVKEGDTLIAIAQAHGITVNELMQANGITDPMIFVGQKLIISDGQVTYGQGISLPEDQVTLLEIGQRLEGERGIFQVNIYQTSQRIWYGFFETSIEKSNIPYMILEGADLENLQQYNNLPINIWGTVDRLDQYGKPIIKVERYEIPFPDLKFQILEGTQKLIKIQGKEVLTFTTSDGTTYVQIGSSMYPLDRNSLFNNEGNKMIVEALIVPDEIFEGYPTMRMYSASYAVDPVSGQANELTITADQFNTYEDPPSITEIYVPPTATIEKVDLVYYVRYPPYALVDPNAGPQYLQPAWRFYGHYSNGDEFEILVQALKQEFLLPELVPYTPPG
ncbi:MAG: LysM peptidoglycan-binding domain-containing protein [Anaerolineae bacterium]|nr:LysM peptidoglycan-binding domain-containing protein [Anaerolineae bacterium]MCI0607775.1 LysM peptidoglycan-binding domain-containing protein [Anaerolineae bacterium]